MDAKNPCANDLDLAAYLDGRLDVRSSGNFERHCAEHADSMRIVDTVRSVLGSGEMAADADAPEHLITRVVSFYPGEQNLLDLVLSLGERTLNIVRAARDISVYYPHPAPVLRAKDPSGAAMVVMTKQFNDLSADMSIEQLSDSRCNIIVSITDLITRAPARSLRVELFSQGRLLGSNPVEDGRVQFEDIGPGRYDLLVRKQGVESGRLTVRIVK